MTTTLPPASPPPPAIAVEPPTPPTAPRTSSARPSWLASAVLLIGAAYCLVPVLWVLIAATKSGDELFSTSTFVPSTHLFDNIGDLVAYRDGLYGRWMLNSLLYAGVGGLLSALVSVLAGYGFAKFSFRGKATSFNLILAGVLVPGVILAVPQYLLVARLGLADTYLSVLLPSIISPYGIYLARIYAAAAVPDELLEAARSDGASEWKVFSRVALPMMRAGLVTVFLFQFVAIWNNFMLPYIMLGSDGLFPVTVGLSGLLNQGATQPALYTLVITGSLLSILPLVALFLSLQRYWQVDLTAGAVKA